MTITSKAGNTYEAEHVHFNEATRRYHIVGDTESAGTMVRRADAYRLMQQPADALEYEFNLTEPSPYPDPRSSVNYSALREATNPDRPKDNRPSWLKRNRRKLAAIGMVGLQISSLFLVRDKADDNDADSLAAWSDCVAENVLNGEREDLEEMVRKLDPETCTHGGDVSDEMAAEDQFDFAGIITAAHDEAVESFENSIAPAVAAFQEEVAEARDTFNEVSISIDEAQEVIHELQEEVADLRDEVSELQEDVAELQDDIEDASASVLDPIPQPEPEPHVEEPQSDQADTPAEEEPTQATSEPIEPAAPAEQSSLIPATEDLLNADRTQVPWRYLDDIGVSDALKDEAIYEGIAAYNWLNPGSDMHWHIHSDGMLWNGNNVINMHEQIDFNTIVMTLIKDGKLDYLYSDDDEDEDC